MIIVDRHEQYDKFAELVSDNEFFIFPIFSDLKYHPGNNDISVLLISFFNLNKDFVFLLNHTDNQLDFPDDFYQLLNNGHRKYTFDKKNLMHRLDFPDDSLLIDVELVTYFLDGNSVNTTKLLTDTHTFYQRMYQQINQINRVVPILKHLEYLYKIKQIFMSVDLNYDFESDEFKFYNNILIPALFNIEKSGLYYDPEEFKKYFFGKSNVHKVNETFLKCQYHFYTTTGRPSNNYGGINFAALQKASGERGMFKSRFDNGLLVEFDFDSYHLRLIGERIGYTFPADKRIHEYFGAFYFNKDKLTEEEYNESKGISFRLLYGGIDAAFETIPYFKQVNDLIFRLWEKFNRVGFIESPISHKRILKENLGEMNQYKLWNYFIQLIETENSALVINEITTKILKNTNTRMILYTYDSFLFDYDTNETELVVKIKELLEKDGKYPVKVSYGRNYHEMKKIN